MDCLINKNCDKIQYLKRKKGCIANSINHNFGKIRIHIILYLLKKY